MASRSNQPWNEFNLPPPPLITIEHNISSLDLQKFQRHLEKAVVFYESQIDLEKSAAFCSRLLARRKNSFRNMPGYQDLGKVNVALCRLLRVDIVPVLKMFEGSLPYFMKDKTKCDMPARKNFDFMMLRMIALHKLYIRIIESCLKSASYFFNLMSRNYFFEILTVFLCTIAQIWKLCRNGATKTAEYYNILIKYRTQFPFEKEEAFYKKFVFPSELEETVDQVPNELISNLAQYAEKTNTLADFLSPTGDMDDTSNVFMEKNLADALDHEETTILSSTVRSSRATSSSSIAKSSPIDLGVVISRDSLGSLQETIKQLKTLKSIQQFVKTEIKKRKKRVDCLTKNVSKKTWQLFKSKLEQLPTDDNRSAVKLIRNLLGSEM